MRTILMDRLTRMALFLRVIERQSFAAAAADMGLGRSTATEAIKALERGLGVRLLDRTTRHLAPTLDGEAFAQRARAILEGVAEAETLFAPDQPQGLLRVDAPGLLTRVFLLPRLQEFLDRHPRLDLQLGQGDRLVDLVREGVDCVLRAGDPGDSGFIKRNLGLLREVTAASPDYLARHGQPQGLADLGGHQAVGFLSSRTGQVLPLTFQAPGGLHRVTLPCRVTVNQSDTAAELARLGHGLIQAPLYRLATDIRAGRLVEVLPDTPPPPIPLFALYPQNRHLAPRVRVFLDWVAAIFRTADL